MFNPFPELLVFGFWGFPQTILRVAAAAVLLYVAYHQYQRRDEIKKLSLPFVGKSPWWYAVSITVNAVLGAMLLVGYYTQLAALLGIITHLKGLWLNRHHPEVAILPDSTIILLLIILLSLVLSGAGALAYDLPL